ncbi:MAG: phosphoribosylamine--glycine ligase [candidate division KSB1 bacterium]|nr:phosphoribosylamine--glycine ligase [candidate division KSB1 bacterium]MDZ7303200.1 phosphoribosylamine--glycine ligase [candidate division KSB1 bacterium]MDZ7312188.1 phosphoribosylamine--glycine ligase [candidate division KSB1 bacterium]
MPNQIHAMLLGVGAFAHSVMHILKENGAKVSCYLTRGYGHYGPSLEGEVYPASYFPSPVRFVRDKQVDLLIPMSIDWTLQPWTEELLSLKVPIFSPVAEAMKLERERDYARLLCERFGIPFPRAHVARNRLEAETILRSDPRPYVIKNPLCSPTSPIHTIVCESAEDTLHWLERLDYAEGVFLQEYMGRAEAGHIAVVSNGEIYSLVTNQEYKRAFNGNMGIVAGAPLGGLVEKDPEDKYGLARALLHPLLPWFRETNFHGPVQVTAAKREGRWHVLEYNVRMGVTSTQMILRLLKNPLEVIYNTANNQKVMLQFREEVQFGCSLTLAGYGYPYVTIQGPRLPVKLIDSPTCDIWWNEVAEDAHGGLVMTGHRIADVVALADSLERAIALAYENIRKIKCLSSYYRTDVGMSLWPPGKE